MIAVNSAEAAVRAEIRGMPAEAREADVLFGNRRLAVTNGTCTADLGPLDVRMLKLRVN